MNKRVVLNINRLHRHRRTYDCVCMFVLFACVCVFVCMCVCVCVCVLTCASMHVCACMSVACMYMCVNMCVHTYRKFPNIGHPSIISRTPTLDLVLLGLKFMTKPLI